MLRRRTLCALTAVAITLSACTPATAPPVAQATDASALNANIVLTRAGTARPFAAVYDLQVLLTRPGNGGTLPIKDGACTLSSDLLTAEFAASSVLRMPAFGPGTPPMTATCTYNDSVQTQTVEVINLTARAYQSRAVGHMFFGFGLIGALATAGSADARDKTKDVWGYAPIRFTF